MISSCKDAVKGQIEKIAMGVKNAKILDIGCGDGEYTSLFCKNGNEVIGLDLKNYVKPEYKKFEFVKGNAKDLPFPNESFDLVISFDVIEHVEDDEAFLAEAYRVVKKRGRILLETPNRERLSHKLIKLVGKPAQYPLVLGDDCIHIREYTKEELEDRFQKAGFKDIYIQHG